VKLLFDQNLSHRLVALVSDCYPGSRHVRDVGCARADDSVIWTYAADHDLIIVSKDSDFHQCSLLYGPPPKVVWIQRGNCTTADIETTLRGHQADITSLEHSRSAAFLVIG